MPSFSDYDPNYGIVALPPDARLISFMRVFLTGCFLILLGVSISSQNVLAEDQPASSGGSGISGRIDRLMVQVDAIEKQQQEILARQQETIETIKTLKILVHRRQ